MKKIVVGLAVMLGFCMCTHKPSGILDVNKALDYCAEQTQRTLTELKTDSGIDYTMMPRNIMAEYCGMITNIRKINRFRKKRRSLRTHWNSFLEHRLMTMIWDSSSFAAMGTVIA